MIPKALPLRQQAPPWQHDLRQAFSRPTELLAYLGLPTNTPVREGDFGLRVPRSFAERMRKGDPADPLFLQVWPRPDEARWTPGYAEDAVGDLHKLHDGGLIHKYHGRALVIATGACAVHCRYCFRQHFPYSDALGTRDHWSAALKQIRTDTSLEEIILSGGDPLSLSDDKLAEFSDALENIAHVKRLRIHTRQPVVLPSRVDDRLLDWLARGRVCKVMVLHVNHPQELQGDLPPALARLRAIGVPLLNQAVLLRGINDRVDTLISLSTALFENGVLPYYLHMLDRVQGAAHFDVDESHARTLMRTLAEHLPGYLVPRLAREDAGAAAKTWLA